MTVPRRGGGLGHEHHSRPRSRPRVCVARPHRFKGRRMNATPGIEVQMKGRPPAGSMHRKPGIRAARRSVDLDSEREGR